MIALFVILAGNVEKKWLCVVGQCFMVKVELSQVAKVLAVNWLPGPIHLKYSYLTISINLITRRPADITFRGVP